MLLFFASAPDCKEGKIATTKTEGKPAVVVSLYHPTVKSVLHLPHLVSMRKINLKMEMFLEEFRFIFESIRRRKKIKILLCDDNTTSFSDKIPPVNRHTRLH